MSILAVPGLAKTDSVRVEALVTAPGTEAQLAGSHEEWSQVPARQRLPHLEGHSAKAPVTPGAGT